jgi:hypothetical protein
LTFVKQMMLFGVAHELAPFDAKNEVIISLKQMKHSKSMDPVVIRFLENHDVDNLVPSFEAISVE